MVPVLTTPRLTLRGHTLDDFDNCATMWADPQVVRFITGMPCTREATWQRLLRYAGHWTLLGFGYWVVELRSDKTFLGEVGLADYHRDLNIDTRGAPEAGWVLARPAHGQGIAVEAMTAVLDWADTRYPETFAMFDPAHVASLRVAKKLAYGRPTEARLGDNPAQVLWRASQTGAAGVSG